MGLMRFCHSLLFLRESEAYTVPCASPWSVARWTRPNRFSVGVLFQTQKMEAVGRLASGVAHDFKHLVQIVVGNCSLLQRLHHYQDPALLEKVADIRNASDKALALVSTNCLSWPQDLLQGTLTNFFQVISGYLPILRSANVNAEFRVECRGELAPFAVDPTAADRFYSISSSMP